MKSSEQGLAQSNHEVNVSHSDSVQILGCGILGFVADNF